MNQYVTGPMIKRLREEKKITQQQLADKMNVSDKTISKWETGRGIPDISLIEPLAEALGISVIELFAGEDIVNTNKSFHMLKTKFYVCPVCGNVIHSTGEAVISCCGITLPPLEAEPADEEHSINIELTEDEYYVSVGHDMTKKHYISFLACVHEDGVEIRKLYPESMAEARFRRPLAKYIYAYCNHHGLFMEEIKRKTGI